MVFVAFPAFQRNQRDTQRRQDYAMLQSQIISKYSDSGNTFPTSVDGVEIGNWGNDPSGEKYELKTYGIDEGAIAVANIATTDGLQDVKAGEAVVYYIPQVVCTDAGVPVRESVGTGVSGFRQSTNNFVIYGSLENGTYCRTAQFQ